MLWSTGIQRQTNKNRNTASSTVSGAAHWNCRISKIYLYLQPVWGNTAADWSAEIVAGQDIGIRRSAFLGWLNNYGHLSYEKEQELLWDASVL